MMSRRHLLVVASQCRNMRRLQRLDEAAHSLADAFLDATGGACDAALPDGRFLLSGELTSKEITEAIESAIRHASWREATLVLALLGHGFAAGSSTRLYFMGYDSQEQVGLDAVDVQSLLLKAVDHVGVNGVIGVIDTCMAAGAVPPWAMCLLVPVVVGLVSLCCWQRVSIKRPTTSVRRADSPMCCAPACLVLDRCLTWVRRSWPFGRGWTGRTSPDSDTRVTR
jgi:hypothetical protein